MAYTRIIKEKSRKKDRRSPSPVHKSRHKSPKTPVSDETETEKDSAEVVPPVVLKKRGGRQIPESEEDVAQSAPAQKEKPKQLRKKKQQEL